MELIKITEKDGKKAISAVELWLFVELNTRFDIWIKRMLEYGFTEGVDYQRLNKIVQMPNNASKEVLDDYVLSLDCAKEIAMIQKNDKGKQARQYFIDCEKQLQKPMSQIDIIIQSAQLLKDIEQKQNQLETRILAIESKPQINAPIEHFSIMGYCHNNKKQISLEQAKSFGVKCRRMCNELGLVIGKVSDPRFGSVNTYPVDVLKEIIK